VPVTFGAGADDYMTLTIGGTLVATYDNISAAGGTAGTFNMIPGVWYNISIDYKNRAGSDGMSLTWNQPGTAPNGGYGSVVSQSALVPLACFQTTNGQGQTISGLTAQYYDLSGNLQSTVYGEGPLNAINDEYENTPGLSWNGEGYFSLFEERLTGQIMLPPTQVTLDFGSIDTSSGPVSGSTLTNYFAAYGITMSGVTPDSTVFVVAGNKSGFPAPAGTNLLGQNNVEGEGFTLNFAVPVSNVSLLRGEEVGTNPPSPSGIVYPEWSVTAYAGNTALGSVGESLRSTYSDIPAQTFNLNYSGITSLVFYGNAENVAGNASPLLTDISYTTPSNPLGGSSQGGGLYYSPWFGYFLYGSYPLVYEYNLGYEYVFPTTNGVYLYDFKSGHFWYTQSNYFPYVYDFTLNSFLYYYTNNANGAARFFYDFGINTLISE